MHYSVTFDAQHGAVVASLGADFDIQTELRAVQDTIREELNSKTKAVYLIFDIREATIRAQDLMPVTDEHSRQLLSHERIKGRLVVTDDMMVKMAAKGMNSLSFGYIDVQTFKTAEEALVYAQENAS